MTKENRDFLVMQAWFFERIERLRSPEMIQAVQDANHAFLELARAMGAQAKHFRHNQRENQSNGIRTK